MDKLEEQIKLYKPLVQQILASTNTEYVFTSIEYHLYLIQNNKLAEANQNYVDEIIYRFHAAALITLRRNLLWMESIEIAQSTSNLFGFCGSLRGLIESAADSYYSLRYVPQNLATYFDIIKRCLERKEKKKINVFKELEDWGLHFLEAGQYKDKSLNEKHFKAKSTWEYLNAIDKGNILKPVYPLYERLCQIVHPSRETTYLFFRKDADDIWGVHDINEKLEISNILQTYDVEYEEVFQKSFNSALITLWIINLLRIEELQSPIIRSINFSNIPEFNKVKNIIYNSISRIRK